MIKADTVWYTIWCACVRYTLLPIVWPILLGFFFRLLTLSTTKPTQHTRRSKQKNEMPANKQSSKNQNKMIGICMQFRRMYTSSKQDQHAFMFAISHYFVSISRFISSIAINLFFFWNVCNAHFLRFFSSNVWLVFLFVCTFVVLKCNGFELTKCDRCMNSMHAFSTCEMIAIILMNLCCLLICLFVHCGNESDDTNTKKRRRRKEIAYFAP